MCVFQEHAAQPPGGVPRWVCRRLARGWGLCFLLGKTVPGGSGEELENLWEVAGLGEVGDKEAPLAWAVGGMRPQELGPRGTSLSPFSFPPK